MKQNDFSPKRHVVRMTSQKTPRGFGVFTSSSLPAWSLSPMLWPRTKVPLVSRSLSGIIHHTDFSSHKMHSPAGHVIISPLSQNKGRWEISALTAREGLPEGLRGLLITDRKEDVAPSRSGPHIHFSADDPKINPFYINISSLCCKTHH